MMIVGIGGTFRPGSSTETALRLALDAAGRFGIDTEVHGSDMLSALPLYNQDRALPARAVDFLASIREADALVLASPGYHGTVSGLVKNAVDYIEELAHDPRPYLTDMPVGCLATAHGAQAAVNTLTTLRGIVHALRGFPTPYGAAIPIYPGLFDGPRCLDPQVNANLERVGNQVAAMLQPRKAAV